MPTPDDAVVSDYLRAARALMQLGLARMQAASPAEYQAVALAVKHGGFFQLRSSLSPAGLCETSIELVSAGGDTVPLMHIESTG